MHCKNDTSRSYLQRYNLSTITSNGFNEVNVKQPDLSTPMDSKKYLFKANSDYSSKGIELITKNKLEEILKYIRNNRPRL